MRDARSVDTHRVSTDSEFSCTSPANLWRKHPASFAKHCPPEFRCCELRSQEEVALALRFQKELVWRTMFPYASPSESSGCPLLAPDRPVPAAQSQLLTPSHFSPPPGCRAADIPGHPAS